MREPNKTETNMKNPKDSPDSEAILDKYGENDTPDALVGTEVEPVEKADGSLEYDPTVWSKAPRKCPRTGRFLPGTGGSLRGGRPTGSRDKISKQMIEICSDLVADKGAEILAHLARTDPAAAMAICLKVVPNSEWMQAHTEERTGEQSGQPIQVNIGVVKGPERLSDTRSQAQIETRQRGLESPVERIERPTEDAVVATQDDADEEAARAERERQERQERQRDAIKAHGGLTGRRARTAAPDSIEYPDEGDVI